MLGQPPRVLSLDDYLALFRSLPLPTAQQRRNFVKFVSTAHSWYKHLPVYLPGAPFYFFLDGAAGSDWVALRDGSYAIAERKERGFHYSDIPTAEYRTRFGFLSYFCEEGTAVFRGGADRALPRDKVVAIPGRDATPWCLPQPVLDSGRAELTAVIHPNFAAFPWTGLEQSAKSGRVACWPAESGGKTTLRKIFKRLTEMQKPEYRKETSERVENHIRRPPNKEGINEPHDSYWDSHWDDDPIQDPALLELLGPERGRQKAEMLKAIDQVCALIKAGGASLPDRGPGTGPSWWRKLLCGQKSQIKIQE
jgi:hypothetical protein